MESIYFSATNPRWSPTTEQEIREALQGGLLEETHYLDLKRELAPGKVNNREHARDLASFAVDGGTILVGIAEDSTTGAIRRRAIPLRDLCAAERISSRVAGRLVVRSSWCGTPSGTVVGSRPC